MVSIRDCGGSHTTSMQRSGLHETMSTTFFDITSFCTGQASREGLHHEHITSYKCPGCGLLNPEFTKIETTETKFGDVDKKIYYHYR